MEKFFSVSVEFNDGTTKAVAARGESPSAVFQQTKQMPGVRRVGKVTEVSPSLHEAVLHGRTIPANPEPRRQIETGPMSLNQPLRGPRVVIDARPTGGEQPFKHLQAPPERPKPPTPVVQKPAVPQPIVQQPAPAPIRRPEPVAQAIAQPRQPEPAASDASTELEYRIIRSRRADGPPYLLQRGTWSQRDGKRIFKLDWEKGFEDRAKAERHLEWVQQSEEELDAVEEETENEFELAGELAEV